ncbi:PepSY domain-containing protein [Ruegeria atlantica]|uniref:PepSY domain-containing protein n=1 Tax=Ruegeria atlantica TaxID=81569 RepID=A0AA90YUU1_9RHOB|nr:MULTISPECIES: PepSY domain-containing protein [Ruegeria]NOC92322.1 PepSY domain-containing protein [Ruegeria sp. HKCCD6604]NOE19666.1 PepSY domain-containing protein [Ruegeria atlantica]
MKNMGVLITVGLLAAPAFADDIDAETVEKIEAYLASVECQMDPDDIEVEDDGYDLDDVICKGGNQFDIKLDKDLNEVSRKAE